MAALGSNRYSNSCARPAVERDTRIQANLPAALTLAIYSGLSERGGLAEKSGTLVRTESPGRISKA